MSAHRDLVNAQQALNEAVGHLCDELARRRVGSLSDQWPIATGIERGILRPIYDRYNRLIAEQMRLDAPGGAAPRYTSINAANANLPAKQSLRRNIILCVVAQYEQFGTGMTVAELKARLRKEHSSVSSAINGLMNRGWLKDSGTTRPTQHDQPAIVWVPTDMAISKVREVALEVADGS